MLQSFTNSLTPVQGPQVGGHMMSDGTLDGENALFGGVFVDILRDLDVLQEQLTGVLSDGVLPSEAQLQQLADLVNESLPQDGNVVPLDGSDVAQALAMMLPMNAGGSASQHPVAASAAAGDLLAAQKGGANKEPMSVIQLERLKSIVGQVQSGKEPVLSSKPVPDSLQMLDVLGHRVQQLMDERANALTGRDFAKNLGDLLKGTMPSGSLQSVSASPMAFTPDRLQATMPALPQASIQTPVGQPGWNQEFGDRVNWMIKQNVPVAEIKLNPAQLGPIEVKVTVNNDQVTVHMNATHAMTRDALESALPRLREMLADSGLNLNNTNVFSQSNQGGGAGGQHAGSDAGGAGNTEGMAADNQEDEQLLATTGIRADAGTVDLFA